MPRRGAGPAPFAAAAPEPGAPGRAAAPLAARVSHAKLAGMVSGTAYAGGAASVEPNDALCAASAPPSLRDDAAEGGDAGRARAAARSAADRSGSGKVAFAV